MKGVVAALLLAAVAVAANECPSDWTQEKLLEHPECGKFYKCTYGEPVEQDCFTGLYFNIENWQCDWPANVDCGDRTVPGQEPTTEAQPEPTTEAQPEPEPTPEPTTEAQPEPEPTTEAQPEPEPTPEPTTEAQPEPEPTTEAQPEPEPTPEPTTEAQPEPEPTTEAQPEPEPTPEPTTEAQTEISTEKPTSPTPGFLENGCPVDPHIHWLLPAEGDCNGFYYCVWGEKQLRACPATLHFNSELQVCDWPENANCVSSFNSFNKHATYTFDRRF